MDKRSLGWEKGCATWVLTVGRWKNVHWYTSGYLMWYTAGFSDFLTEMLTSFLTAILLVTCSALSWSNKKRPDSSYENAIPLAYLFTPSQTNGVCVPCQREINTWRIAKKLPAALNKITVDLKIQFYVFKLHTFYKVNKKYYNIFN